MFRMSHTLISRVTEDGGPGHRTPSLRHSPRMCNFPGSYRLTMRCQFVWRCRLVGRGGTGLRAGFAGNLLRTAFVQNGTGVTTERSVFVAEPLRGMYKQGFPTLWPLSLDCAGLMRV